MNSTETRDEILIKIRPIIPSAVVSDSTGEIEKFQNSILRPVIKLQHKILVLAFRNYLDKHKAEYYALDMERRKLYLDKIFKKDINFRNQLGGIILGQFTEQEFKEFHQYPDLKKRLITILKERILDHVKVI